VIEFLKAVDRGLDRLDVHAMQKAQDQHDALTALRPARQALFSSAITARVRSPPHARSPATR
jgi:hypothetical protein